MSPTSDDRVVRLAVDYSAVLKPPWWRPLKCRRWKRDLQAVDAYLAIRAALMGEYEPARQFGVRLIQRDLED